MAKAENLTIDVSVIGVKKVKKVIAEYLLTKKKREDVNPVSISYLKSLKKDRLVSMVMAYIRHNQELEDGLKLLKKDFEEQE